MTVKPNEDLSLSAMKAQMKKMGRHLKPSKATREKEKAAQAKAKKAVKVTTDVKPKETKAKAVKAKATKAPAEKKEKKVIDKAANLANLKKTVNKVFSKGFTIKESTRVSRYGGMLEVSVNKTNTVFEVWDELELNDRICIYTNETAYDTYKAKLSNTQRDNCVVHPKWKMNRQFYIMRNDIDGTLKEIATGCATLVK